MTKLTARKLSLGLALAATALTGAAYAQQTARGDGDRVQTRSEAQTRAAAMFARMDANKDGKLDKADHEARRNLMFDHMDSDKNGQISRAEFGSRPHRDGMTARPDGQGDGHHGWRKGRRGHGGGMMMGRMADADKDGAVTQAEFTSAALQRFDRADANKDGQVTKEERQSARKAMRDEWRAKREAAKASGN